MFKIISILIILCLCCLLLGAALFRFFRNKIFRYSAIEDYERAIHEKSKYLMGKVPEDEIIFTHAEKDLFLNKFDYCYFVHGTFVGDDPFHIYGLLTYLFPEKGKPVIEKIQLYGHKNHQAFIKDFGNFNALHISALKQMVGDHFPAEIFTWSSGNNHLARVNGALNLLKNLINTQEYNSSVLLIGHSHAGQIFALMSLLINNLYFRKKLGRIIGKEKLLMIEKKLKFLKSLKLTFVTMGTPPRYQWHLNGKMKLIHFINHRGEKPIGGGFAGLLSTKDGDYVQQWGIAGSDIVSPLNDEAMINSELNQLLGEGSNIVELKKNIKAKRRLHKEGINLLVDYRDQGSLPNFFKTALGHGVYTKVNLLPFHLKEVLKQLN